MKIFKFGGASVKDAEGVKNIVSVLEQVGYSNTLLVISAMGKTTNALEDIVEKYLSKDEMLDIALQKLKKYHITIVSNLFFSEKEPIVAEINDLFIELTTFLNRNKSTNYNFVYDQVICFGELLSTIIVSAYLNYKNINATWLDVRQVLKTDTNYRGAIINWEATTKLVKQKLQPNKMYVTQGFIASDANNFTTTLGREGSDYTAAILGYCLNATSVTIWKDVLGVLNADPRYFTTTQLLHKISYKEAIELAFYGASVIHPKTLQPLQKKEIPLYVKSFKKPLLNGTKVSKGVALEPLMPCFIVKKKQLLVSLSALDFSFIMEKHISQIFALFHQYKMKVNLIQNSAISFSVCIEDKFNHFELIKKELQKKFRVTYNKDVALYTIRHFNDEALQKITQNKTILLKQTSRETIQLITP